MVECKIEPQSQRCILLRSADGMLVYSIFSNAIDSKTIQESMMQQGFAVIGAMFVPDAIKLIQKETQISINTSEFSTR